MRNTRRAIAASTSGTVSSRSKDASEAVRFVAIKSEPSNLNPEVINCQATRFPSQRRGPTFVAILQAVRQSNVQRLKNRAFAVNRLAKLVAGPSRSVCYKVKDEAINALVKHGAAFLHSLEPSSYGPTLGIAFAGGGRLHVKPSCLDREARRELQGQFAATLHSTSNIAWEIHNEQL